MIAPERCTCGNQLHDAFVKVCGCGFKVGFCPEHGGLDRTQRELETHQGGHVHDAKTVKCKWCDWRSDPYDPRDQYGKDRAFDSQRAHARGKHMAKMRELQRWLDESSKG